METENEILQLGGPHHKTCEYCGIEFYGRRNQKFCDPTHKAAHNNHKRSENTEAFEPWFKEMKTSYRALQYGLHHADENGWILSSKLTQQGFDPDCATKEVTNKKGEPFERLLDIVFRLSKDQKHVQIFKYK